MGTCPICKLNDVQIIITKNGPLNQTDTINCPRCKKFNITYVALSNLQKKPESKISAWIRNLNEQNTDVPLITTDTLKDLQARLPDYSPREKQIKLLQNIERMTAYPGKKARIVPEYDIPLAWASTKEEFVYYINSLIERGFLRGIEGNAYPLESITETGTLLLGSMALYVEITANGWDYLEKQERHIEERTQAFVAMSFSNDLQPIWEGPISNAIKKAGYKPYRVDAEPHNDLIDLKIISEIKNSRFLVAEFTEQKYGVYFEAGYAQGMGLPIIRCVREDDFKNLHFDTNHYNYIIWKTTEDLEDQLYNFICAIIGKGKEV